MHKKIPSLLIALIGLTHSCTKEINMNLRQADIRLVMNAVLYADSAISVHVSTNIGILDRDSIVTPPQTQVKLYESGKLIETMDMPSDHYFKSTLKVQAGKGYKLEASAPGYPNASSEITIPVPVQILKLDTMYLSLAQINPEVTSVTSNEATILNLTVNFIDPVNEQNYYILRISHKNIPFFNPYPKEYYDSTFEGQRPVYQTNPSSLLLASYNSLLVEFYSNYTNYSIPEKSTFSTNNNNSIWAEQIGFSDYLCNGKHTRIYIMPQFNQLDSLTNLHIELLSITSTYFNHIKSFAIYGQSNEDPFAEKVSLFTNVNGGYGLVGACSVAYDSLYFVNPINPNDTTVDVKMH